MSDTEYDPMDPGNEDSNDRYTTMPKFAALQTAPLLFQSQHIQTQLLPLPLTAPVAPWLISTQHIPLPPSTHHHPPPMSHPPPPSAPLPPSQPILPSAHYQPPPPPRAVIPAPPNVDIPPPPPPLATVETVDEDYVHESAYSPSQAEDDEVEKKKVLDKIEKNAISLAQQKQNEIENLIRNKEKESHEHTRRMEMENKKIEELRRRKINNSLGPIKLKKIKMKGFEADDDQGNEIIEKEIEGKSSIIKTDKTKQSSQQTDVDDNTEINSKPTSSVKAHFMTQVASYLIHNPSQASTFLKSKRNDKDYEFLYDIERLTKDGKMYREISEKLQAEKNVRNIVNDPVQNFTNSVTLIGVTAIAKNIPSGGAPDYSLLNPFMDPTVHHVPSIAAIQSVASSTISSSGSRFSNSNSDSITNNSIIQKGNHVITTPLLSSSSISASTSLPTSASTSADVPKSNRRNRWGPSVIDTTQLILPVSLTAPAAVSVPVPMMSTVSVPVTGMLAKFQGQSRGQNQELSNLFDERDEERERIRAGQVREQKELQLLEGRIREAASQSIVKNKNYSSSGNSGSGVGAGGSSSSLINSSSNMDNQSTDRQNDLNKERLIEYNLLAARYNETDQKDTIDDAERNRGIIDGGTWEHRKRAREMLETAEKNSAQTMLGRGSHFMGDFLPKQELEKFLKNADALSNGLKVEKESDYEGSKIKDDNIGFQMLKKAGWSEGLGLGDGVRVEGISVPLNTNGQGTETVGLGVTATHEVEAGDDQFDQYRKRMMLAYRFRPNPLNNPRRDYY